MAFWTMMTKKTQKLNWKLSTIEKRKYSNSLNIYDHKNKTESSVSRTKIDTLKSSVRQFKFLMIINIIKQYCLAKNASCVYIIYFWI